MPVVKPHLPLPRELTIMVGPPGRPEELVKAYEQARQKEAEGDFEPTRRILEIRKDSLRWLVFGENGRSDDLRRVIGEIIGQPIAIVVASIGEGCQRNHWGPVVGINLDESKLEDGASFATIWDAQATRELAGFFGYIYSAPWMFTAVTVPSKKDQP